MKYTHDLYCCVCKRIMKCGLVTGKNIYPHRPDLYTKHFYKCPACGNYVGCHERFIKGGYEPLGCIPTPELKSKRHDLHLLLDPLWESGKIPRKALYKKISEKLGYEYHTGNTKSIEEIETVENIIQKIIKETARE